MVVTVLRRKNVVMQANYCKLFLIYVVQQAAEKALLSTPCDSWHHQLPTMQLLHQAHNSKYSLCET